MKLTLAEPRLLVDSVSVISELVNEVRIKVDKEKIDLVAMDPANVAMVDFKLLSSAFTEYVVEEPMELCLSLDALKSVLKRVRPSDMLTLVLDDTKHRLQLQLQGENTRTFQLSLIDVEEKEQKVPELQFAATVATSSMIFDNAIQDIDVVTDAAVIAVRDGNFIVEGESTMSKATAEIANGETKVTCTKKEGVQSKYSVEYLKKINKGSKLASNVQLQFAENYPLRIDYSVKDKLNFAVILAPRVAND